jgi:predicted nucleic acid-binding protein
VIHLDTSFLIDLLREQRRRTRGPAQAALDVLADDPLGVSVFALCELEAGIPTSTRVEQERAGIRSMMDALTAVYPDVRFPPAYAAVLQETTTQGRTIATMDLLIGVTALVDGAPLVTRNRRHFAAIPGLQIVTY